MEESTGWTEATGQTPGTVLYTTVLYSTVYCTLLYSSLLYLYSTTGTVHNFSHEKIIALLITYELWKHIGNRN